MTTTDTRLLSPEEVERLKALLSESEIVEEADGLSPEKTTSVELWHEQAEAFVAMVQAAPSLILAAELLPQIVEALEGVLGPTDDANERFEWLAEEFRRETGLYAPGKLAPAALGGSEDDGDRWFKWNEWHANRRAKARAALARVREAMGEGK